MGETAKTICNLATSHSRSFATSQIHLMKYEEWEANVHELVKREAVWQMLAYQKALFLYDLVWLDGDKLKSDLRGQAVIQQLIRSAGSISANIEEGHGRGVTGKEYLYFLRVALGSARESKGWYWRGRLMLPESVVSHRLSLLDEVISLLITELNRRRKE